MTPTTSTTRHAEIAGAGIGGLTAAAALAQRGWSVTVHESSPDLRSFGAGIYIWSNGLRVLKAIGAYDEAIVGCHYGPIFETRDHLNQVMETIPINQPNGAELVTMQRKNLLSALANACRRAGVDIRTGSTVEGLSDTHELLLQSGETRAADLIVGADGVHSRVRDALDLIMYNKSLGYGAGRAMIDADAMHCVDAADRLKYIEHFSGSRRILYTPVDDHYLYIALCSSIDDTEAHQMPANKTLWKKQFPHLAPLIDKFDVPGRWDEFFITKLKAWSKGKVAIIGDAAHAMPPYLGQGGGCALMNGLSLADFAHRAAPGGIEEALTAWEASERPITEHTQDTAERLGDMNFWPDEVRSQVLKITGECHEIAAERMKTALHVPTAADV